MIPTLAYHLPYQIITACFSPLLGSELLEIRLCFAPLQLTYLKLCMIQGWWSKVSKMKKKKAEFQMMLFQFSY